MKNEIEDNMHSILRGGEGVQHSMGKWTHSINGRRTKSKAAINLQKRSQVNTKIAKEMENRDQQRKYTVDNSKNNNEKRQT